MMEEKEAVVISHWRCGELLRGCVPASGTGGLGLRV